MTPGRGCRTADAFAHRHRKRDDVVLDLGFELVNARHVDLRAPANRRRRLFGDLSGLGKRVCRGYLHFQPAGELIRVAPDAAHFFARVSWNQILLPEKLLAGQIPFPMIPYFELAAESSSGKGSSACKSLPCCGFRYLTVAEAPRSNDSDDREHPGQRRRCRGADAGGRPSRLSGAGPKPQPPS